MEYRWIQSVRLLREKKRTSDGVSVVRSYLQVHQLELDSLGQQIRENKRNGRLVRRSRAQTSRTSISCRSVPDWLLSSLAALSLDVNLTLCDAKCLLFLLFSLQGSLYELDKVSFIHTCCVQRVQAIETVGQCKIFCVRLSSLIIRSFFFPAASKSHREVYAPLGIPSEQGVYVCMCMFFNFKSKRNESTSFY